MYLKLLYQSGRLNKDYWIVWQLLCNSKLITILLEETDGRWRSCTGYVPLQHSYLLPGNSGSFPPYLPNHALNASTVCWLWLIQGQLELPRLPDSLLRCWVLSLLCDQLGNAGHHWPLVNAQLKKKSSQTNGQIYTACLVTNTRIYASLPSLILGILTSRELAVQHARCFKEKVERFFIINFLETAC